MEKWKIGFFKYWYMRARFGKEYAETWKNVYKVLSMLP